MPEQSAADQAGVGPTAGDEGLSTATPAGPVDVRRRIVLVAGSGRSGTSLMSGILKHLGVHVPEPEVAADGTNPKGFGEPQWVVDFHDKILSRINVHPGDARPSAWFDAGMANTREHNRVELAEWLQPHFDVSDALVIKDPRLPWFLGLWRVAAMRTDATTSTITMLRPPAEVVVSKNTSYGGTLGDISRLAGWANVMLGTERATRNSPRAFVQYHDLVTDWTKTVVRIGEELGIEEVTNAGTIQMKEVHDFVDPQLHRVRAGWDDLSVPARLREVAEATWEQLRLLGEPGGDNPDAHHRLDGLRRDYGALYAEAEAVTRSSIIAAGPAYLRETADEREAQLEADRAAAFAAAGPARKAYLGTRRAAGRVKRRLDGGA